VDGPDRKVLVLDQETLKQVSEIVALGGEQIRCAIAVKTKTQSHIFLGCTNGVLIRLDSSTFSVTMCVRLRKHIFCLLQVDEDSILCGQLYGYLDLVGI
jgi:hypothetical protein